MVVHLLPSGLLTRHLLINRVCIFVGHVIGYIIFGRDTLGVDGESSGATVHEAEFYTCDLSHEYVTINGDYRT